MSSTTDSHEVCATICQDLRELCQRYSGGGLTEQQFISAVLQLEEGRVHNHGLILLGSNTSDDWTQLTIRSRQNRGVCLGFEFNPASGEFREVGEG